MPCWTITKQPVKLEAADPVVLEIALKKLGFTVQRNGNIIRAQDRGTTFEWARGEGGEIAGKGLTSEQLTKSYRVSMVHWAAKKAGWTVQNEKGNTLEVMRR